jgi:hypothetical protein
MNEEFRIHAAYSDWTPSFSDIPTLSHSRTLTPISHAPKPLGGISTNPQLSSPQQAL